MKKIILFLISLYRKLISPHLEIVFGKGCRFTPTCSVYCQNAIERYGTAKGVRLTLKRLSSCHGLSRRYYFDPVPTEIES
ncbi:MAG: membrane protein insertion efficiency factor YidD [Candidatus Woesebacteria bacterium]